MEKRSRWLALASATAILVAACSSGGATQAPASDAPSSAPTTAPVTDAPPAETVTITFRTRPDNDAEAEVYKAVAAKVSEMLGDVTVEYQKGGTETAGYQDTIKTEAAAGTAPDVFWIPGTDTAEFATKGITLDLRRYAAADSSFKDADFYEGPMFHLTFDPATGQTGGPLWGLPRDVSTFALYLNTDLIA